MQKSAVFIYIMAKVQNQTHNLVFVDCETIQQLQKSVFSLMVNTNNHRTKTCEILHG